MLCVEPAHRYCNAKLLATLKCIDGSLDHRLEEWPLALPETVEDEIREIDPRRQGTDTAP